MLRYGHDGLVEECVTHGFWSRLDPTIKTGLTTTQHPDIPSGATTVEQKRIVNIIPHHESGPTRPPARLIISVVPAHNLQNPWPSILDPATAYAILLAALLKVPTSISWNALPLWQWADNGHLYRSTQCSRMPRKELVIQPGT